MYQDVLVPTDGSPQAEAAVGRALALARAFDATVHALFVAAPPDAPEAMPDGELTEAREAAIAHGEQATARVVERARELDVDAVQAVREGSPHLAIVRYAHEADVDVVAMGTHGETGPGRVGLGSTTRRVVERARQPVLAVPLTDASEEPDAERDTYEDVVVATDGSDAADRAAQHALGIAEAYGARVHAVYVVDAASRDLERIPRSVLGLLKDAGGRAVEGVAASARERDLAASSRVLRGLPEEALLRYARGVDADLVAMGARGAAAPDDRFLGSTTARVLRRSEAPVLAVT